MKYKDKTLIITTESPQKNGVFWFERYFDRIYETMNRTKGIEIEDFQILHQPAPASPVTRLDKENKRKLDWSWFYNHITKIALEGGFNNVCYHFTSEERDDWNLQKSIGGLFENDGDEILEYYIIADRGEYSRRYDKGFSPNVTEFERRFLHEKLHGYVSFTDRKKTTWMVDGEKLDIVHYHDYERDNIHAGFDYIDFEAALAEDQKKTENSDLQNLLIKILSVVAYIQSILDSRGVYPVEKDLFMHNSSQRFLLPSSLYQSTVHNGYDVAVPIGTEVYAPFDCEVYQVFKNHKSMGNAAYIRFKDSDGIDWEMRCLHLSENPVVGSYKKGDVIGRTGNTGLSTGPHLHIDVWRVPIDTSLILTKAGVERYLVDPYAFFLKHVDGIETPDRA